MDALVVVETVAPPRAERGRGLVLPSVAEALMTVRASTGAIWVAGSAASPSDARML
ncbi:hypothetical protein LRS03_06230 [Rhizobacter sp. J219]|uniref:hypothetical protein n=1 Tax=Rhizobacter sp. J219 TaxID=2898430 RepID=UPI002150DA99|nr:hypothetical protein [Rhizobacter sp. J219]MCR5882482.1 hypothetical protein [Rhizobacter sp. J219]